MEAYRQDLLEAVPTVTAGRMAGGAQAWPATIPSATGRWCLSICASNRPLSAHMVEGTDTPAPRTVDLDRVVNQDRPGPLNSYLYGTLEFVATEVRESIADAPVTAWN